MKSLWNVFRMFLWITLITGIVYPLVITGVAQLTMKHKANGSILTANGKQVGSKLIAQKFESDKYFWPRPSSIDYIPLPSSGSNLGPTSTALKKVVEERRNALMKAHDIIDSAQIPSELLYSSGSGLDPHISPTTAYFQVTRVLKARAWDDDHAKEMMKKLIDDLIEKRRFGFIGDPCINILQLNMALDNLDASLQSIK